MHIYILLTIVQPYQKNIKLTWEKKIIVSLIYMYILNKIKTQLQVLINIISVCETFFKLVSIVNVHYSDNQKKVISKKLERY